MKAKRRLSNISFDHEGAHVALVGKFQGGPANGQTTLVFKATDDISEEALEKAMSSIHEGESTVDQPSTTSNEDVMQEEIQKAVEAAEVILKAVIAEKEELLKAKEEELTKALAQVAEYEKAQKEAVAKSRKEVIADVEKDAAKAEELFKSLESLPQEAFDNIVKALKEKEQKVEDSDLFTQKSKNTEVEENQESGTAAILKAKYNK